MHAELERCEKRSPFPGRSCARSPRRPGSTVSTRSATQVRAVRWGSSGRLGNPARSFPCKSRVFRMDTFPCANPASLAFVDEIERGPSVPCLASEPFGDSAHEARSDRLGPEYAPHRSWSIQRWGRGDALTAARCPRGPCQDRQTPGSSYTRAGRPHRVPGSRFCSPLAEGGCEPP